MEDIFSSRPRIRVAAWATLVFGPFVLLSGCLDAPDMDRRYEQVKRLDLTESVGTKTPWNVVVFQRVGLDKAISAGPVGGDQSDLFNLPVTVCFKGRALHAQHCLATITKAQGTHIEPMFVSISTISLTSGERPVRGVLLRTIELATDGEEVGTRIWRYSPITDSFDLVATASGSEASEVKLFSNRCGASFLVTSNYIWAETETHPEPHHFRISIKLFPENAGHQPLADYVTLEKYPILRDDEFYAAVIAPELPTIVSKVLAVRPDLSCGPTPDDQWLEIPQ